MTGRRLTTNGAIRTGLGVLLVGGVLAGIFLAGPAVMATLQGMLTADVQAMNAGNDTAPNPDCKGTADGALWTADSGLVVEDAGPITPPANGNVFPTADTVAFRDVNITATDTAWIRIDNATSDSTCLAAINATTVPITVNRTDGRPVTVEDGSVDLLAIGPDDEGNALVTFSTNASSAYNLTVADTGVAAGEDIGIVTGEVAHNVVTVDGNGTATLQVPPGSHSNLTVTDSIPAQTLGIDLTLEETVLATGTSTNATVTAALDDNTSEDVTGEASLNSSNESVVTVTNSSVTAVAQGQATISATHEGHTDSVVVSVTSSDPDPFPESYFGTITINGAPAPAGTTIEATIDGEVRGSITVTDPGQYGGSSPIDEQLIVNGTQVEANQTVTFHVSAEDYLSGAANQTSPFQPEGQTELNLSADLEVALEPVWAKELDNTGEAYAIGFPGPVNGTLADVFPSGYAGMTTFYAYENESWEQVYEPNTTFAPLDVLVVATSGEGPGTIPIEVALAPDTPAANRTMQPGWNHVAAPQFVGAEAAFDVPSALAVLSRYGQPNSSAYASTQPFETYVVGSPAWGVIAPSVNPFTGYFVYVTEESPLPVTLSDIEHKQGANDRLGLGD